MKVMIPVVVGKEEVEKRLRNCSLPICIADAIIEAAAEAGKMSDVCGAIVAEKLGNAVVAIIGCYGQKLLYMRAVYSKESKAFIAMVWAEV